MRLPSPFPLFTLPVLALLSTVLAVGDEMNLVNLHVDKFTVVGFEARTSNAQEMNGDGPISKLWGRLQSENFLTQIPNRVDRHMDTRIVAVYSDYQSDKDGPYTYLLGAKVSSPKDVPPGMVSRTVVSGTYAMFTAEGGPPPEMVVNLWKRIWSLEKPDRLHRAYKTDYEVHYSGSKDPVAAHVDVYIGVQEKR